MKQRTHNAVKSHFRTDMVQSGAYDGRFGTRVVVSKKKQKSKLNCRTFRYEG